jgi:hypothetical protein
MPEPSPGLRHFFCKNAVTTRAGELCVAVKACVPPESSTSQTSLLLTLINCLSLAHAAQPAAEKRELLSSHSTIAKFTGIKDHRCMGLTRLCPDRCGSSGELASFEIIKYLAYKKTGKYGDAKQEDFQILIQDNMGKVNVPADILAKIRALKPGDKVKLDWNHDYVTKQGSSSAERPITKLEKAE